MTKSTRITLIVDSNTLTQNPDFNTGQWNSIITLCNKKKMNLLVPEVVLAEVGRQWADSAEKFFSGITRDWDKHAWPLSFSKLQLPDTKTIGRERYISTARKFLESNGARTLPIPDVSITNLLERDLDKRQPFDLKGKGFRDAVIWHSIVEFFNSEKPTDQVIFVTANKNDFVEGNEFSEVLRSELPENANFEWKMHLKDVIIDPEIAKLLEEIKKPYPIHGKSLTHGESDIELEPLEDTIFNAIELGLEYFVGMHIIGDGDFRPEVHIEGLDLPGEIETATIESWNLNIDSLESQPYESYEMDRELHVAKVSANMTISGVVHKHDMYIMDSSKNFYSTSELNDHYLEVETEFEVVVHANIDLNPELRLVESCDIDSIVLSDYPNSREL